jgi:signal transduction histidine kinase
MEAENRIFEPEDLERVFDKFYRVQRPESVSGTGLGLSIAKKIISDHHGEISVRSEVNRGSVFKIRILWSK